jgi:mediator of RNA polymerase II transcription subunit 13
MSSPEVYSAFIAAVAGTVSFRLASSLKIIPLSINTIALPDDQPVDSAEPVPVSVVQTSAYLSSAGTLILSAVPSPIPALLRLTDLNHVAFNQQGAPLVLAPIFLRGSYLGECDDFDAESKWQEMLALWLNRKGVQLEHLDLSNSWVKVVIQSQELAEDATVVWPKALCFVQESALEYLDTEDLRSKESWFQGDADSDNFGQIHAAVRWAQSRAERTKLLETRNQRQQEVLLQKATATSPMNSRAVQYGDSHGPLGVYPTPPDGLSSQQPNAGSVIDTPAADTPGFFAAAGLDLRGVASDSDPMRLSQQSGLMHQSPIDIKMSDDIFGEDDFGGEDITDADFSYFDKPDEEEFAPTEPKPLESPVALENPPKSPKVEELAAAVEPAEGPPTVGGAAPDEAQDVKEAQDPKVENTPLSPVEIRRRLFPASASENPPAHKSLFLPLQFNSDLSTLDQKYSTGLFRYKGLAKIAKRERSAEQARKDILLPSRPKRLRYDPQTSQLLLDSTDGPDSDSSSVVGDLPAPGSIHSPRSNVAAVDSPAEDSDAPVHALV